MNPFEVIDLYYPADGHPLREILLTHSWQVVRRAMRVVSAHPELEIDRQFVVEGALLHDIGIVFTDADKIHCHGDAPYVQHGVLGAQAMRKLALPRHARVCERHTGTGISITMIRAQQLPLPLRDLRPQTLEEQVICFADKFYSKTRLAEEKTPEQAIRSLERFGEEGIVVFRKWLDRFG